MFEVSIHLCRSHNMTPFEMFAQDADEVIMLINFYIERGEHKTVTSKTGGKREERIKVNDRTATGGWW